MKIQSLQLKEFGGSVAEPAVKKVKPFQFGAAFKGEVPPPPPAPTFSEEQMKAAERDHYRKGFLEGTEEGKKQEQSEQANVERQLMESLQNIMQAVTPMFDDYRAAMLQMRQDVPKVALAIARKVAGAALADNAAAMVEDVAKRCVDTMIGEPRLTITVHNSLAEALEKKLAALVEQLQSKTEIVVIRDETAPIDSCRIQWNHGEFARHTGQLWQEIERIVDGLVASARHSTGQKMQALETQLPPSQPSEKE